MSLSLKNLLFLLLILFLLTGCGAINYLQQEEFTGPSWDVNIAIPLWPMQTLEIGRELAQVINEDLEGPIGYQDSQEIYSLEIGDLLALDQSSFESIVRIDLGGEAQEEGDRAFASIRDFFANALKEEFPIDDLLGDALSLEAFSYTKTFSSEEEDFPSIDDQLQGVFDSFLDYQKLIELPSIDRTLENRIYDEIGQLFSFGPEDLFVSTIFHEENLVEISIPFDFHSFKALYLSSSILEVHLENKTETTITSMDVALYDRSNGEDLADDRRENIERGATGVIELHLEGVSIGKDLELNLILMVADPIEEGWVNLYLGLVPGWSLEKVQVLEENNYTIFLQEPIENLSSEIREALFQGGTLELDLRLPEGLIEEYELSVQIGDVTLTEGSNDLAGKSLPFYRSNGPVGEVIFRAEDVDTYIVGAKAHLSFSLLDPKIERVEMVEPFLLDLPKTEVYLADTLSVEEVSFSQGDLFLEVIARPEAWEDDLEYSLEVYLGEEVFYQGVNSLVGRALYPERMEILSSVTTHTYYEGASLEVKSELLDVVVDEARLKRPIEIEEVIELPLDDWPSSLQEITIEEGYLEIEIHDDGLDMEYSLEMTLDGQRIERVLGSPSLYSLAGITIGRETQGLTIVFEAKVYRYVRDAVVKVAANLSQERDFQLGRIVLAEPLVERFTWDLKDMGADLDFLELVSFSKGLLGLAIESESLELEHSLECWLGGERLSPVEEGSYVFSLEDRTLSAKEGEGFIFQLTVSALTFDPKGSINAKAWIEGLEWKEIGVALDEEMGFLELALFHEGEEEIYPLYLEDLPSYIKQLRFNPALSSFHLAIENETSVGLSSVEPLLIRALNSDGESIYDEEGEAIEAAIEIGAHPFQREEIELLEPLLSLLEAYPHSLCLSGGLLKLGPSEEEIGAGDDLIIIRPDMRLAIEADLDVVASLIITKDPLQEEPFVVHLPPRPVSLEIEGQEVLESWIKEATLYYTLINHMPLFGTIYLSLGEFEGDLEREEDVESFYSQEDLLYFELVHLPLALKDEDGFAIGESPPYEGEITFAAEDLSWLTRENLHVGLTIEIPLDNDEFISFSTSDYIKLSAWANSVIQVNPKDRE